MAQKSKTLTGFYESIIYICNDVNLSNIALDDLNSKYG